MSKYASLLFSPDEYHEIGPFRFPIYHDLIPGEARGIEDMNRKQSRHTFNSIKLAKRIATDKGITTKEAVDLLSKVSTDDEDIFYDYAEELDQLQQLNISPTQVKLELVTLFMKYRGEVNLPESGWSRVKDWTEEDSEAIPTKYLNQISQFITWERDGWPQPEGKQAEEDENSPPTKSSPKLNKSSEASPRTGTTST